MKIINPYRFAGASSSLLTDLVSWWSMDETSGTRADSHGSYDLAETNGVAYGTGKVSNAALFDSTQNEVLNNASISELGGSFSFTGWFNYTSLPNSNPRVFTVGATNCSVYVLQSDSKAYLNFSGATMAFGSALSSGTWYFFYAYGNASTEEKGLSINDGTPVTGSVSAATLALMGSKDLRVGVSDSTSRNWNGLIDELAFWSRQLTSDEVSALYNSGNGIGYPG